MPGSTVVGRQCRCSQTEIQGNSESNTPPELLFESIMAKTTEKIPNFHYCIIGEPLSRYGKALNNGFLSDVTFLVGDKSIEVFQAHKLILSLNSTVFYAMFFGALPEVTGRVHIKDVEPETFRIFLQFIYCGLLPTEMPLELGINVLGCARKYDVQKLEELMIEMFTKLTDPSSVTRILETSIFFDVKNLEKFCWEFIEKNAKEIVGDINFTTIMSKTLAKILERETLNISEGLLFDGVLRWAQAECTRLNQEQTRENLRSVLGDNLKLLRLASMTASEFADGPGKSGVFTEAEIGNILMNICSTSKGKSTTSAPMFSSIRRRPIPSTSTSTSTCNCLENSPSSKCTFCVGANQYVGRRLFSNRGQVLPALVSAQTPPSYCKCRSQGRCPAVHGPERSRRPFSNLTLGVRPGTE